MFEGKLADRMSNLGTESAFEVLAKAKKLEAQGKEVIHLEIGEPDFDTPTHIIDAAVDALRGGFTHYTPSAGSMELRQTIADYIWNYKQVKTNVDEVVVVPGGKPIMFFTMLALVNPGDEVIYPNPGFPIYESVINFTGGVPVPMPILEENDFKVDFEAFKKLVTNKTKLIILNSPSNPTGGVFDPQLIRDIAAYVAGKGIFVLADEIYDRMIYEGTAVSIATMPGMKDYTIILDGFSKTYAMTGWRMGYGVMHSDLAAHITRLMTNSNSCTAAFTQQAGIAALTGPQTPSEEMVAEFKKRRDIVVAGLNAIQGVSCKLPAGAFYAFPNIKQVGIPSPELAERLLQEANVATLNGTAFGQYGDGYLRLSYANSVANLEKALDRMNKFILSVRNV